jgi:hypothetical protein
MPENEKLDYPSITMQNSKQEIVEHLRDVHYKGRSFECNYHTTRSKDTKATKSDLLALHEKLHEVLDSDERTHQIYPGDEHADRVALSTWYVHSDRGTRSAPVPAYEHTHSDPIFEPDIAAIKDGFRIDNDPVSDKPLSAAERTLLRELVDNDFNTLKKQMQAYASDVLAAQLREINTEWDERAKAASALLEKAGKVKRAYQKKYNALLLKHEEERRTLIEKHRAIEETLSEAHGAEWLAIVHEAEEAGVTMVEDSRQVPLKKEPGKKQEYATELYYRAEALGRQEAIDKATELNKRELARAELELQKEQLTAQRKVLVSGVSKAAASLLDKLPDAKSLMMEAVTNKPKELEA